MLDGRVLEASQVEYEPFGKTPLKRDSFGVGSVEFVVCFCFETSRRASQLPGL